MNNTRIWAGGLNYGEFFLAHRHNFDLKTCVSNSESYSGFTVTVTVTGRLFFVDILLWLFLHASQRVGPSSFAGNMIS
jgi:hypothetical protein